jgi:hypothetical protein
MKPLDLIPKTNAAAYRFHIEMRRGRQPAIIERDIFSSNVNVTWWNNLTKSTFFIVPRETH